MTVANLSAIEQAWLSYAREVVGDDAHRQECALAGGSPAHPGVDATDLRWPGYLGERAKFRDNVLCVGNVHREFASGALRSFHRDRLVDATRAWRDGGMDDAEFLAATRRVYLAGLNGWAVGNHIRYVVAALGRDLLDVVFTNAARCQYPEIPPPLPRPAATKVALQHLCLARFPLTGLVSMLQPRLVVFTSASAHDAAATLEGGLGTTTVCMHQLNGLLVRPVQLGVDLLPVGTRREVWAPAVADFVGRSPAAHG